MDTDDEEERTHEGVERVWGPLPFALTSAMGAHAPVCFGWLKGSPFAVGPAEADDGEGRYRGRGAR